MDATQVCASGRAQRRSHHDAPHGRIGSELPGVSACAPRLDDNGVPATRVFRLKPVQARVLMSPERATASVAALLVTACLAGCTSSSPSLTSDSGLGYQSRAETRSEGNVAVSAAALSAIESEAAYGLPLAEKGIQPVWVEIRNGAARPLWLLYPGLDPNFFPASEAADAFAVGESREKRYAIGERFARVGFRNPVLPGETRSGFVLTHLEEGVKLIQLDLVADDRAYSFSLFTIVPGFRSDYQASAVFRREVYPASDIRDYENDTDFRAALEALPCCATNRDGTKHADPLNLVIVGGLDDAFPGLVRRGWRPTETKWSGAIMRVMSSALSGERYLNAPVSDLYLFGRPQDLALQKARDTIHQRNHLRLWLSPIRYRAKPVWIGQISRDIGSRLTIHSPTLTTHKIDPDVDEARTALAEDMAYSQNLALIGYASGVGAALPAQPRENLTTDPYYTDGDRLVLVFDRRPVSLDAIQFLRWYRHDAERHSTPGIGR